MSIEILSRKYDCFVNRKEITFQAKFEKKKRTRVFFKVRKELASGSKETPELAYTGKIETINANMFYVCEGKTYVSVKKVSLVKHAHIAARKAQLLELEKED